MTTETFVFASHGHFGRFLGESRVFMTEVRTPLEIINAIASEFDLSSDAEVLAALADLPALEDETDDCWVSLDYWESVAYRYLALAEVASIRRLRPAISLLLDRACFGDPGEIMRGLRHSLEAIVDPDWAALADICMGAAISDRPGTRLWAIDQLTVIEDPRAEPIFQNALRTEPSIIAEIAEIGLERLARKRNF